MRFTKMQGAGNDYIYVNLFDETLPDEPASIAQQVSDRHFGIGGDGLVLIMPSDVADARMRMFNADGSESEMCGNAIRCVGKFLYDHRIAEKDSLQIETGAGVLQLELELVDGQVARARVNMGPPVLQAADIPTNLTGNPVVDVPLRLGDIELQVSCVSMGNPHCITFVPTLTDDLVLGVGPRVETSPEFPRRVNVEFVEVISPHEIRMRVWERGSGETMACGTGAAAACVAGVLSGRTERRIVAHLLGGDLELEWAEDGCVYKTGPAVEVFHGEWLPTGQTVANR